MLENPLLENPHKLALPTRVTALSHLFELNSLKQKHSTSNNRITII